MARYSVLHFEMTDAELERFKSRVMIADSGCHVWIGYIDHKGYGKMCFWRNKKVFSRHSHIFAYWQYVGAIPYGFELDHLCRNTACCNPAHLEAVTHRENVLRGISPLADNARKTHCSKGHEYTPENTYRYASPGSNARQCRTCTRVYKRLYKLKVKMRHHE